MYITERIKSILQSMTECVPAGSDDSSSDECLAWLGSYIYEDRPTSNVRLDRSMADPVAILYQLSGFDVNTDGMKCNETVEINVSFLMRERKLDARANEQEYITDDMYEVAKEFIARVFDDNTLKVLDDIIHVRYVYLNTDSNRTGCNLTMTLQEKQAHCL